MRNPRVNGNWHIAATLAVCAHGIACVILEESLYHVASDLIILSILVFSVKQRGKR